MQLILFGERTSILTSLIPESAGIELITLSKSMDVLGHNKSKESRYSKGLIIVDSTACNTPLPSLYQELNHRFPTYQIWVYYLFKSSVIYNKLQKIGFDKILSSTDDIPKLIHQHFEPKYNKQFKS